MPGPWNLPVAQSIPFNNSLNGYAATNVQGAIEEARSSAYANDLYPIFTSYNGNAITGRYFDIWASQDSFSSPFPLIYQTNLIAVVARTTTASATCTIGFFDISTSTTVPLYSFSMVAQKSIEIIGTVTSPLYTFPSTVDLAIKVTAGTINTPHMYVLMNNAS